MKTQVYRAITVRDSGSRKVVPEDPILIYDDADLQKKHKQKQPRGDVNINAWKGFVRGQMPPHRIDGDHCKCLMRPEEEFVGEPSEKRTGKQKEKTKR
jgi:hypothetical protein